MSAIPLTAPQLIEGLRRRYSSLRGLHIKAVLREVVIHGQQPGAVGRSEPDFDYEKIRGDSQLGHSWMRLEARLDGERRLLKSTTPELGDFRSSSPMEGQRTISDQRSWDGEIGMSLVNKAGRVFPKRQNHCLSNPILWHLGWATSDCDHHDPAHAFLPEWIESNLHVEPQCRELFGHRCVVAHSPGRGRLWVDPDGFKTIRQEVYYWGNVPRMVTDAQDWTQWRGNVHLPRLMTRRYYVDPLKSASQPELVGKVSSRTTILASYENRDFEPSDFRIDFPAGAVVIDEVRRTVSRSTSTGEEPLQLRAKSGLPWASTSTLF